MKTSLLLVAHGSRRAASNDEVHRLTAALAERAGDRYHGVSCAFLELAEPSIPDGVRACLDAGAGEVVVLPFFLSAGRHVAEDIPGEVEKVRAERPEARIRIAPYLGAADAIPALLLELAGQ